MCWPTRVRAVGRWPQLGNVHRNGERFVGRETGPLDPYYRRGTPPVSRLYQLTVTAVIGSVRVDDLLEVSFDGDAHWWAYRDGELVGRLTWAVSDQGQNEWRDYAIDYPDRGRLLVTRLLLNPVGEVVNCGGIVTPFEATDG